MEQKPTSVGRKLKRESSDKSQKIRTNSGSSDDSILVCSNPDKGNETGYLQPTCTERLCKERNSKKLEPSYVEPNPPVGRVCIRKNPKPVPRCRLQPSSVFVKQGASSLSTDASNPSCEKHNTHTKREPYYLDLLPDESCCTSPGNEHSDPSYDPDAELSSEISDTIRGSTCKLFEQHGLEIHRTDSKNFAHYVCIKNDKKHILYKLPSGVPKHPPPQAPPPVNTEKEERGEEDRKFVQETEDEILTESCSTVQGNTCKLFEQHGLEIDPTDWKKFAQYVCVNKNDKHILYKLPSGVPKHPPPQTSPSIPIEDKRESYVSVTTNLHKYDSAQGAK